jgi:hypothetical protein
VRVVRALLREPKARPRKDLESLLRLGNGRDVRVLEDTQRVADRDALSHSALPCRVLAAGEPDERLVGRAALHRLDERRELRREPPVDLDDPGVARLRDEELDVEEAAVEAERGE